MSRREGRIALVIAVLAGCGTQPAHHPAQSSPALRQLRADIHRIKVVAAPVHHSRMGTPKLLAVTGKFLDDEQRAPIDNLTRNRLIDLAASAVAGSCDQCFQQLEAARPIPAIAHS